MSDDKERSVALAGSTAHDRRMTRRMIMSAMAAGGAGAASADAIQFVEATPRPILIAIRLDNYVPAAAVQRINEHLRPIQEKVGIPFVIVPKGMTLEAVLAPRESVGKP